MLPRAKKKKLTVLVDRAKNRQHSGVFRNSPWASGRFRLPSHGHLPIAAWQMPRYSPITKSCSLRWIFMPSFYIDSKSASISVNISATNFYSSNRLTLQLATSLFPVADLSPSKNLALTQTARSRSVTAETRDRCRANLFGIYGRQYGIGIGCTGILRFHPVGVTVRMLHYSLEFCSWSYKEILKTHQKLVTWNSCNAHFKLNLHFHNVEPSKNRMLTI